MPARRLAPSTLVAALALAAAWPHAPVLAQDDGYVPPSLVRLTASGRVESLIDEAIANGWDVCARAGRAIEVVMPRSEAMDLRRIQKARDLFGESGRRRPARRLGSIEAVEILRLDLDEELAAFRDRSDAGAYHTWDEVNSAVDALVAAHPDRIRKEAIGTTLEGRRVVAVEITAPGARRSRRPATLITGLHHAREWISVEVPMAAIRMLVEGYGSDPWVTSMLDSRRVWVVPVVNPDGLVYSQTKSRMWRKNRRPMGWTGTGVDPNRNYGYQWGGAGASGMAWSDTYRGPEAFSEPETQAVRDLALREKFQSALSFHSYSELVLWPWGYTYDVSPGEAVLKRHGDAMGALTKYKPMKSSGLYRTSGDLTDWFFGATGALAYTIELGRQFVPPEKEIPAIVAANLAAVRYFVEHTVSPR